MNGTLFGECAAQALVLGRQGLDPAEHPRDGLSGSLRALIFVGWVCCGK